MKTLYQLMFIGFILIMSCCNVAPPQKNFVTVTYYNGDTEEVVIETRHSIVLEEGDLSYIPDGRSNREVIRSSVRAFTINKVVDITPDGKPAPKEIEIKKR